MAGSPGKKEGRRFGDAADFTRTFKGGVEPEGKGKKGRFVSDDHHVRTAEFGQLSEKGRLGKAPRDEISGQLDKTGDMANGMGLGKFRQKNLRRLDGSGQGT